MEFIYRRSYAGPLQALILDWAGTAVDHGCFAPVAVFTAIFEQRGISVSAAQARAPMGLEKRAHIRAVAQMEPVARQWQDVYGRSCTEEDITAMFEEFLPLQKQVVADYAEPVPELPALLAACRARRLKIGTTTGYSRAIMEALLPEAQQRGYTPDSCVCPDDVPAGRPAPWMCFQNAMNLGFYPMEAGVKVGDTLPDVAEGLNAGMWTVAVVVSGNDLGLTREEFEALEPPTQAAQVQAVRQRMYQAGAHYVIDTLDELPAVLDDVTARLRRGERP
jgi:phosphonoacetaldehyde hydrolase